MAEVVDQFVGLGTQIRDKLVHLIRWETPADQVLKKIKKDPKFLPTIAQLRSAFNLDLGNGESIPSYWNIFVRNPRGSHEILTSEYINGLATYLTDRVRLLRGNGKKVGPILEVGAGEGNLAYFINNALGETSGIYVVPTDAKTGLIQETTFPVEKLDVDAALLKYSPTIVISSWMPEGVDWTDKFRKTPSVEEYILIGNTDNTGKSNNTWGDHQSEGFERVTLDGLIQYQLPRFLGTLSDDLTEVNARGAKKFESITVSFRRKGKT